MEISVEHCTIKFASNDRFLLSFPEAAEPRYASFAGRARPGKDAQDVPVHIGNRLVGLR